MNKTFIEHFEEYQQAYLLSDDPELKALVSELNLPTSYNRWIYEVIIPRFNLQVSLITGYHAAMSHFHYRIAGNAPQSLKASVKFQSFKVIINDRDLKIVQLNPYSMMMMDISYFDLVVDDMKRVNKLVYMLRSGLYDLSYAPYLVPTLEQYHNKVVYGLLSSAG